MKKHLIILIVFLVLNNLFAQQNNGWQIQVGPEINFTEAKVPATISNKSKNITIKSFYFSAGIMKNIFVDNIYVGGIYSFGRTSYSGKYANIYKYVVITSVITGQMTFSLIQEYLYTKLENVKADGLGLGVKINFAPFKSQRLSFWASSNQKNQALGLSYIF